jgi:hypothetical protein
MHMSELKTNPKQEADNSAGLLQLDQRSTTASSEENGLAAGNCTIGLQVRKLSGAQQKKNDETVQHITCCCEALARQRYNVFGSLIVKRTDISTVSVRDLCLFIQGTGLRNLS